MTTSCAVLRSIDGDIDVLAQLGADFGAAAFGGGGDCGGELVLVPPLGEHDGEDDAAQNQPAEGLFGDITHRRSPRTVQAGCPPHG